jgi:hypothetical protein
MKFFMKLLRSIRLGLLVLACVAAWAELMRAQQQEPENAPTPPAPATSTPVITGTASSNATSAPEDTGIPGEDRMLTPPPVSGLSYPLAPASEDRANYLRGGVTFTTAYSDNVLASTSGTPVSDVSYSVWPTVALDETTTRLHAVLTYAPGFTFYQRVSAYNQADQNLGINLQYRLSPHVTFLVSDGFQKTSNVFNQPDEGLALAVSGSAQAFNDSVIAPIADQLSNNGNVGITYQYSANAMMGASGAFTNIHFPDSSEVQGLFDDASRVGSAFYAYRISPQHYVGALYQYQDLLSYPGAYTNRTQTDAAMFFYTFFPVKTFSLSFFGGPQYYNSGAQYVATSNVPLVTATQAWTPAAGASMNWQLQHSNAAISYLHSVSGGSGLIGAVKLDAANASIRGQITRNVTASVAGSYANNGVLAVSSLGGHSISGSVGLQRQFGQHVNAQAGYTRLHQTYDFFSANPDTNREWISISYQFARPLGR